MMKKNNQTSKTKITKIERILISGILTLLVAAPIITIAITSQGFAYIKQITSIDNEIEDLKQNTRELELKKLEKLSYSEVQEYAMRRDLSAKSDSYIQI